MASISIVYNVNYSETRSEIIANIVGLDTQFWTNWGTTTEPYYVSAQLSCGGQTRSVSKGSSPGTTTNAVFSMLTPGQTYTITAAVVYQPKWGEQSTSTFSTTEKAAEYVRPTPDPWYWSSGIKSGALTTALTAAEWNDFTDWLAMACEYAGVSCETLFSEQSGNTMSASHIARAVRSANNIFREYGYPTLTVPTTGTPVMASLFTNMSSRINNALGL